MAILGCMIFSLYLIYDFHQPAKASKIPNLLNDIGKAPLCKAMCKADFDESHIIMPEKPSKIAKVS